MGDYIYIASTPDYNSTNGLKVYANRELAKFEFKAYTQTIAAPSVLTDVAHGLSDGDGVLLVTDGALPTNFTADSTIYYVSGKADDTFKLSATPSDVGSTEIEGATSQSGTHNYVKVSGEPGIPVIHHPYLARYAAKQFMKIDHPNFSKVREELSMDEREIQDYWQSTVRQGKTIIETARRPFK